jgi:cytochrome o ubiquinol oxidase subunit IV
MSTKRYFESIGAWPHGGAHMERTYVLGFLTSLALTLGAYSIAVYKLIAVTYIIPVILIFACLQFLVQVLNFLHVNGETSSRERLVVLGCAGIIMLILVLGSMWIMTNLDARMMPERAQVERYMARQTGI